MSTPKSVLVVGAGGREHALALAISRDPAVHQVHVAPGNPGTEAFATNHPVDANDPAAVADLAEALQADLVVIGPEAPLVAGVADEVRARDIACFGPSAQAAQLEASKAFAKEVMGALAVPTARARVCRTSEEAAAALEEFGAPYVVKDDALAAGKGVVVTDDRDEALAHADSCRQVVIEEFLDGPEVSLFAICDGNRAVCLQPVQDFKRVGDNDTGPNTGGMGAYTPLPWAPEGLTAQVQDTIITPVLTEMRERGTPFIGLLYVGLALTSQGPRVVEFNVRFGDPETQPLLARLKSPLAQVLYDAARGQLAPDAELEFADGYTVGVVLAAANYPDTPRTGDRILGVKSDPSGEYGIIHAGTDRNEAGELISAGGRVLTVLGTGPTLPQARAQAYHRIQDVKLPDSFYRTDIALKAVRGDIQA